MPEQPFLHVTFTRELAGKVAYVPFITFPGQVLRQFPMYLEEAELVLADDCDNGQIVADWRLFQGNATADHSDILCYVDSSDSAGLSEQNSWPDAGILFCRRDHYYERGQEVYRIHIPCRDQQERLITLARTWVQDSTGEKIKALHDYLASVVASPSAWEQLYL